MSQQRLSIFCESNVIWKTLWKINAPAKVNHFLWRAITNTLPTRVNLHCCGIPIDEVCAQYNEEKEISVHAIWKCLATRIIWDSSNGWSILHEFQQLNCDEIAEKVIIGP